MSRSEEEEDNGPAQALLGLTENQWRHLRHRSGCKDSKCVASDVTSGEIVDAVTWLSHSS